MAADDDSNRAAERWHRLERYARWKNPCRGNFDRLPDDVIMCVLTYLTGEDSYALLDAIYGCRVFRTPIGDLVAGGVLLGRLPIAIRRAVVLDRSRQHIDHVLRSSADVCLHAIRTHADAGVVACLDWSVFKGLPVNAVGDYSWQEGRAAVVLNDAALDSTVKRLIEHDLPCTLVRMYRYRNLPGGRGEKALFAAPFGFFLHQVYPHGLSALLQATP